MQVVRIPRRELGTRETRIPHLGGVLRYTRGALSPGPFLARLDVGDATLGRPIRIFSALPRGVDLRGGFSQR